MAIRISTLGVVLAGLVALAPASTSAQRVQADIRIGGGPIGGRILIGDRPRPRGRLVVVERRGGRPVWLRRDYGYDRRPGLIVVYYDPREDRYYDRHYDGLEEVRVFNEGGRFYRYDDFDRYYRDRGHRDPRWGNDDRYRDGRWNGRDRDDYRRNDRDRDDHRRNDRDRDRRHRDGDRDRGRDRDHDRH